MAACIPVNVPKFVRYENNTAISRESHVRRFLRNISKLAYKQFYSTNSVRIAYFSFKIFRVSISHIRSFLSSVMVARNLYSPSIAAHRIGPAFKTTLIISRLEALVDRSPWPVLTKVCLVSQCV